MLKSRTLTDLEHVSEKRQKSQFLHHVCTLSHFSHVRLFATLWTIAFQAPLSMGFSRQEYYTGLPCPPPGDLPNPGIEPASLTTPALQVDSLPAEPLEKPQEES